MLEKLKQEVLQANLSLYEMNLALFTWGNVSGIDSDSGIFAIKPSGVAYEKLKVEDIVLVDLNGNIVEGNLNPSSDTPTHMELYKKYNSIKGICHTHSKWATTWSQIGKGINAYGTTHADYFYGKIPCSRELSDNEVNTDYEANTGRVIIETISEKEPLDIPAVLVKNHGPFTWGKTPYEAVYNARVLEEIAEMALNVELLSPSVSEISKAILDKHYLRKHGKNSYYGQKK